MIGSNLGLAGSDHGALVGTFSVPQPLRSRAIRLSRMVDERAVPTVSLCRTDSTNPISGRNVPLSCIVVVRGGPVRKQHGPSQ